MENLKIPTENRAKINLILSMTIFGTIGIFRKYIPLSSSMIALVRGIVGCLFLLLVIKIKKQKISLTALKDNLLNLILSGVFIGFNWILLFEAYNNTSVAIATLCYYMAPVIVILLSPFVVKEMLTPKKWLCIISALIGMVFISGVLNSNISNVSDLKGIFLGLGAATLYAFVVLLNKKIMNISPFDKTIYQLAIAALTLLPYTLFTEELDNIIIDGKIVFLLLFVGIIHTGITYYLYFGSISVLSAQRVALYSYIDPIVAIVLSALVLNESFGMFEAIGTFLILGSTIVCEIPEHKLKK